jgi:hypothetical protein
MCHPPPAGAKRSSQGNLPLPNRQRIALTGPTGPAHTLRGFHEANCPAPGVRCPWFGSSDNHSSPALAIPVAAAGVCLFISALRDERSACASLEPHRLSQIDIAGGLGGGQNRGEPGRRRVANYDGRGLGQAERPSPAYGVIHGTAGGARGMDDPAGRYSVTASASPAGGQYQFCLRSPRQDSR